MYGKYKVGNPYQIKGVWYYPKESFDHVETGIASWYGRQFHLKKTANGEIFDMNELTAAHRTLQMPSFVQVTNLENGRSLKLRVNDRGPFAHGRIIDVSRRAAQLLGFERQGTARVRVQILGCRKPGARVSAHRLRDAGGPGRPADPFGCAGRQTTAWRRKPWHHRRAPSRTRRRMLLRGAGLPSARRG